jgi:hypothetical protein
MKPSDNFTLTPRSTKARNWRIRRPFWEQYTSWGGTDVAFSWTANIFCVELHRTMLRDPATEPDTGSRQESVQYGVGIYYHCYATTVTTANSNINNSEEYDFR